MSSKAEPFLLKPVGKDYLWGGERLKTEYGKELNLTPLAESWECSTHPDGESIVSSGAHTGKSLRTVLSDHPEYRGTHPKSKEGLPILVKLIDAKQDLSVQVHPDDAYAKKFENGESGKMEMWYVLDATPGSQLVYGFSHDLSRKQLEQSLRDSTIEKYLQWVPIQKDDIFFIEAGMVHAIGAGALIVEVQQSSNLTYRLFDYNRRDSGGNLRELHLEKALAVVNRKGKAKPKQPLRILRYRPGAATEVLYRCSCFQVERHFINTEQTRKLVKVCTGKNSFKVFICLDGCGVLYFGDNEVLNFFKGDCIFVPANSEILKFHGKARFISVHC